MLNNAKVSAIIEVKPSVGLSGIHLGYCILLLLLLLYHYIILTISRERYCTVHFTQLQLTQSF